MTHSLLFLRIPANCSTCLVCYVLYRLPLLRTHALPLPRISKFHETDKDHGYNPVFYHVDLTEIIFRVLSNPSTADELTYYPSYSATPSEFFHGDLWKQSPLFTMSYIDSTSCVDEHGTPLRFHLGDDVMFELPSADGDEEDGAHDHINFGWGQLAAIYLAKDQCQYDVDGSALQWLIDIRLYKRPREFTGGDDRQCLYLTDDMVTGLLPQWLCRRVKVHMGYVLTDAEREEGKATSNAQLDCITDIEADVAAGVPQHEAELRYFWCVWFKFPSDEKEPEDRFKDVRCSRILPSRQFVHPQLPQGADRLDRFSGKEMRILRIFLSLFYDAYGAFNRTQYSIGGIYVTLGNMKYNRRQQMENAYVWGLVPPDHDLTECLACLVPQIQQLERGFRMTLHHPSTAGVAAHDEDVWIVGGIGVITGDVPQANKLANLRSQNCSRPCRMCKVDRSQLNHLNFNIDQELRLRQEDLPLVQELRRRFRGEDRALKRQARHHAVRVTAR